MTRQELIDFIRGNIYPNGQNQITAPMVRDAVLAVVAFLGDAAVKDVGTVIEFNDGLVTGGDVYNAIRSYLSTVLNLVGETTTDIVADPIANPVYVDGEPHIAKKGDVVIYGAKEFWWNGTEWKELGDEASWALKTITITGEGDITGGGTLEANRTLDLTQEAKDKLAHGETAFSWFESYLQHRLRLKTPYDYLNVRKGLILEPDDYATTPADLFKQVVTIDGVETTILRSKLPIVSDSFMSSGGLSANSGGGGGGISLDAMWNSLTNSVPDAYASTPINIAHIPNITVSKVTDIESWINGKGYMTNADLSNYLPLSGGTMANTNLVTNMNADLLDGYNAADFALASSLSGYLPLSAGINNNLTGDLYIGDRELYVQHGLIIQMKELDSSSFNAACIFPGIVSDVGLRYPVAIVRKVNGVVNDAIIAFDNTDIHFAYSPISGAQYSQIAKVFHSHNANLTTIDWSAANFTAVGVSTLSGGVRLGTSTNADAARLTWDELNNAWHLAGNFYADGFVSAGGLSSGSGSGGIDLDAMWGSLTNSVPDDYANTPINIAHIPNITVSKVSDIESWINGKGYLTTSTAASTYQPIISDLATIRSNANLGATAYTSLSNYLPLTGGTMTGDVVFHDAYTTFDIPVKSPSTSSGWAREPIALRGSDNQYFFHFGVAGAQDTLEYGYIGPGSYYASNNLRLYSDRIQYGTYGIWHAGNLSLASLAGNTSIGSSNVPIYYNGASFSTCDLSTTYAAYNAAGYLPLTGGTITGDLYVGQTNSASTKVIFIQKKEDDNSNYNAVCIAPGIETDLTLNYPVVIFRKYNGVSNDAALAFDNTKLLYCYNPNKGSYINAIATVLHSNNYTGYVDGRFIYEPTSGYTTTNSFRTYNDSTETGMAFRRNNTDTFWIGTFSDRGYLYRSGRFFSMYDTFINYPGSVSIGASSSTTPGYALDVSGSIHCDGALLGVGSSLTDRAALLLNSPATNAVDIIFRSGTYTTNSYGDWAISSRGNLAGINAFYIWRGGYNDGNAGEAAIFGINPNGQVIIGQSIYGTSTSHQLEVLGTLYASGAITGASTASFTSWVSASYYYVGGASAYLEYTNSMLHSNVGFYSNAGISAGGLSTSSDARLKTGVRTIDSERAWKVIMGLRPTEFRWIENGEESAGFIAQEVEPIVPFAVKEIGEVKRLNYDNVFTYGIQALKDMKFWRESTDKRIERLERKIDELQTELNRLRA